MKAFASLFFSLTLILSPYAQALEKKSVYKINPWVDGAIIGAGSIGVAWAHATSTQLIKTRCPCDPNEVNSIDRNAIGNSNEFAAHLSDGTLALAVIFPVALDYIDVGFSKEFAEDMIVYAETLSVNGSLLTLAKYGVQRPVPRSYEGDPTFIDAPRGYRSFYSGHTSVTVAALSTAAYTYSLRHPGEYWPWLVAGIGGASVAFERVAAGRHFYSDVIVGGIMGAAVGIAVPYFHARDDEARPTIAFMPTDSGAVGMMKVRF